MTEMLSCLVPYLDKHLVLGLLYFYDDQGVDVGDALRFVQATTALTPEGEVSLEQENKIRETAERARPALDMFFEQNVSDNCTYQLCLTESRIDELRGKGELSRGFLEKEGITPKVMTAVMDLAFLYYDAARYGDASELLSLLQCVTGYELGESKLLWGRLVCDTCSCRWPSAIAAAEKLWKQQGADGSENKSGKTTLRGDNGTSVTERVWLLHWALFPFFKGGNQYSTHLLNIVFDNKTDSIYQCVVETVCPHYLRYICAAAILNTHRRSALRRAAEMVGRIYEYSDPLTQLVREITNYRSFEDTLELLPKVSELAQGDYFLNLNADNLVENAKRLIFTQYVVTHSVVSIPYMAERLEMSAAGAEVWLADLISETKQRAKIDAVTGQMFVGSQVRSVHQTVLDRLEPVDHGRR
ncbi:eukaryotic translation initiation factor [Trypanosoma brucei equiperdum]|uniref:Eukaryotic translation initiation factor 3 subunit E n=1 Tax=Trypanosoma brucei equiperdum TaxID=630700 RepID=A0A3L6KVH9_9TRYP|nr:eukaryotic translation initiation factor [Trypanosoma brucei equiperdum]